MSSPVVHIAPAKNFVPVLAGAAEELVTHRELRSKYCTNRSIKTWATWFLLKSLSTSGIIQRWTDQRARILDYCKCSENSFRARLNEMAALKLISITDSRSISLASYQTAARILGIPYSGLIKIEYDDTLPGQQIFQYFLRAEEIRSNQVRQTEALWYYAHKNPLLKDALVQQLLQMGADKRVSSDQHYFQLQLLKLQKRAFKEGSPLFGIIHQLRADVNRSCKGIRDTHTYKSAQSVSYMKRRMQELAIVKVSKVCIESTERSRLYVEDAPGQRKREAYKWLPSKKVTAWFLTDQITPAYKTIIPQTKKNEERKAA